MFEKLNRARADYERNAKKLAEAQKKFDESAERLKEVERTEILGIVASKKLSPEQLAELMGVNGMEIPTVETATEDGGYDNSSFAEEKEDEEAILDEDF